MLEESNSCPNKDCSKDDEGEGEVRQGNCANGDKDCSKYERKDNTNEKNSLMVFSRHCKLRQDDYKYE
jgi:hypothetical protein